MHTTPRLLRLEGPYMHRHPSPRPFRLRLPKVRWLRTFPGITYSSLRAATAWLDSLPTRPQPHPYGPQTGEHPTAEPHLPDLYVQP